MRTRHNNNDPLPSRPARAYARALRLHETRMKPGLRPAPPRAARAPVALVNLPAAERAAAGASASSGSTQS